MLLKFAIQDFLDDRKYNNLTESTITTYMYYLKQFEEFCHENEIVNVEDINTHIVKKFIMECRNRGNNATSTNSKLTRIRAFFNYMIECEVIQDNPAKKIKRSKVVVLNTSRLWCSDNAKVMIKRQLMKANAEVLSIEQPTYSIYDKDPNEFLINSMMELLDQYDRMNTNLKLAKGRRTKVKATGQKGCGIAPIGYKWNHEGDKPIVIIDNEHAPVIKEIYARYLELKSIGKVKKHLDEKGYKTQRGKAFSPQAINNILTNDFYKGILRHGNIEKEGNHDPIINKIVFGKVQALLNKNNRKG